VSIIILNYNGKRNLETCLTSVMQSQFKELEIILVDNNSTDGSVDFVRTHFPNVKVIENNKNVGFAEGNNIGAKNSLGAYLIFLNNDTKVTAQWVERMVESVQSDPTVGICGCKVLLLDKPDTIDVVGGFACDKFGTGLNAIGHLEVDNHQYDSKKEVFSIVGASLLIRRDLFRKIGGFDAAYFLLGEDIDLSWRARLLGYKVIVNPLAVIYHKSMGTFNREKNQLRRGEIRFLSEKNTLRSLLKNYSSSTLFKLLPVYFILQFYEVFFFMIMQRFHLALADIKSVLWNLRNFASTWVLHVAIQQIRVIDDKCIQKKMMRQSLKVSRFSSLFEKLFGRGIK
jgi:GT2 family glycosyltransferase